MDLHRSRNPGLNDAAGSLCREPSWTSRHTAALWALQDGADAELLTRQLGRRYGKASARRTVDIASARLWLAEGFPVEDVATMLEGRHRFELSACECRAHAVEILLAVRQAMLAEGKGRISPRHEVRNAAA
jgi:hypothetical protein